MKTQALKSVTVMALIACLYASSVAFTEVRTTQMKPCNEGLETIEEATTIHHWVTKQLGFPKFLERQEETMPVMLSIQVGETGIVKVLSCTASMPELTAYVQDMINGRHAQVNSSCYGQQFEMKINFKQM